MKNNLENRERFFGQYIGNDVYCDDSFHDIINLGFIEFFHVVGDTSTTSYLLLKQLKDISENDMIAIAKIGIGWRKTKNISITESADRNFGFSFWLNHENEYMIMLENESSLICLDRGTDACEKLSNITQIYDYLRSKGYAVPYMGLSVRTLVEYGWVKLIK